MTKAKDKPAAEAPAALSSLADLAAAPYNPRTISAKALAGLGYSLAEFGDISGIVWNQRTGQLVAGHQRVRSLRQQYGDLRIEAGEILTPEGHRFGVRVVDWPEAKEKAANVAANAPTISGDFTADLTALVDEIAESFPDAWQAMDFGEIVVPGTGDGAEDGAADPAHEVEEDEAPAVDEQGEPDSVQGEVYQLGPHRLLCGDCRDFGAWQKLLAEGERVNVCFTSPPYASQRKYDEASEFRPIPPEEYSDWWEAVQRLVREHLVPDGSFFVNIKEHCEDGERHTYVLDMVLAHKRKWGWMYVDEFCWRRAGVPGGWPNRFKNGWEPVFHFATQHEIKFRPDAVSTETEHAFDYSPANGKSVSGSGLLGKEHAAGFHEGLARPSNVIDVGSGGAKVSGEHPAEFPVGLPDFFVRAYSDPDDLICDPFMGSGSTMIAAAQNGRRAVGFEISPRYCDVIRRRWTRWAKAHNTDPGPGALD